MTNRRAGMIAAVLCATGLVSAVGLAFELQRPQVIPYSQSFITAENLASAQPALALDLPDESPVIRVAPVVIVGTSPERSTGRPEVSVAPRDISQMHCSDWKGLEQGSSSQRVRLCS